MPNITKVFSTSPLFCRFVFGQDAVRVSKTATLWLRTLSAAPSLGSRQRRGVKGYDLTIKLDKEVVIGLKILGFDKNRLDRIGSQKTDDRALLLSREEFIEKHLLSRDAFIKDFTSKNPQISDQEKIERAYDMYCSIRWNKYRQLLRGGNPALAI